MSFGNSSNGFGAASGGGGGGTGTNGTSGQTYGTSGTSGNSGTAGTSGDSGSSGSSGTSASSGSSGSSATAGTTGTSGSSGSSATAGTSGSSGSSATSGDSGTAGTTGTSGSSGESSSGTSGVSAAGTIKNYTITLATSNGALASVISATDPVCNDLIGATGWTFTVTSGTVFTMIHPLGNAIIGSWTNGTNGSNVLTRTFNGNTTGNYSMFQNSAFTTVNWYSLNGTNAGYATSGAGTLVINFQAKVACSGSPTPPPSPSYGVAALNSTFSVLNNFVAVANTINVVGLTAVTITNGLTVQGTATNLVVGTNTIVLSTPSTNITINTIKQVGNGSTIYFTQSGAGSHSVTATVTLNSIDIFNGILIDII